MCCYFLFFIYINNRKNGLTRTQIWRVDRKAKNNTTIWRTSCLKASLAIDKTWYSFFIRWCDAMLLLYPIAIAFWEFIYLYMFIVVLTLLLDFGLLLLFETKEFLYLLSGNWNTRLLLFSLSLSLLLPSSLPIVIGLSNSTTLPSLPSIIP